MPFSRTPSDAREASLLFDRCDRRLGLQFDHPKVKPCAEVLLPAHEPTGARFVGGDRSADRIPILKGGRLPLYRVVYFFGRRAHCRSMHLPKWTTHLTGMFTEDNLRIYVDANRDLDKIVILITARSVRLRLKMPRHFCRIVIAVAAI